MTIEDPVGPGGRTVLASLGGRAGPPASGEPSGRAKLIIKVGPDKGWGSVQGSVPPDQAHHLVTAGFIWGSVAMGIAGAVLTLRISPALGFPACAELVAGLAAAALIAACSFTYSWRRKKNAESAVGTDSA